MSETVEKNNRFYTKNGEIITENEQLKEWLIIANKEIERLNNIINNAKTFIQESCYDYDYDTYSNMFNTEVKELVDILGSDKE